MRMEFLYRIQLQVQIAIPVEINLEIRMRFTIRSKWNFPTTSNIVMMNNCQPHSQTVAMERMAIT